MNTATIIHKKAGQDIAPDFLALAMKQNQTAFGICLQDKVAGKDPILDLMGKAKALTADTYNAIEGIRDIPAVIWLANLNEHFDKVNDLQPFDFQMIGEKDKDGVAPDPESVLCIFIEGDFPKYNKPDQGHTDEYNLWEDYLFPTLLEKFELANGDVEDFYARLRTKQFSDSILNTIGHRGVVMLVPLDGDPIVVKHNELGAEYAWGSVSNRYNYGDKSATEKVADAATAVVSAVKGRTSRLAKALGTTAPASLPVLPDAPKKEEKKDNPPGVHTIKSNKPLSGNVVALTPPSGLQGNARNTWIRTFMGLGQDDPLPKDKDHSGFKVSVPTELVGFAQEPITTKEEARALQSRVKSFLADGAVIEETPKPDEVKNPPKEDREKPADSRPTQDFLPDISADDKRGAVDLVTGWASKPKDKTPSALDIQRIESKWPPLSTTMGIKFEDMCRWPIADLKMLAKKYPDVMALAFVEMRLKAMENTGVKLDTAPKPEVKTPDKQVEVPSVKPGPAPAKTSRLARLTGAGQAA